MLKILTTRTGKFTASLHSDRPIEKSDCELIKVSLLNYQNEFRCELREKGKFLQRISCWRLTIYAKYLANVLDSSVQRTTSKRSLSSLLSIIMTDVCWGRITASLREMVLGGVWFSSRPGAWKPHGGALGSYLFCCTLCVH